MGLKFSPLVFSGFTTSGGGNGTTIGTPVSGGTPNSVLFINSFGNLAQDNANFSYDENTTTLDIDIVNILTSATINGQLSMANNKIINLASGTSSGEALQYGQIGVANGIASLDSGGKVPASQLPSTIMEFKGAWNASTNTPTLADGIGDNGDVYRASVAGTQNLGSGSQTWGVGDLVIYNGSIWQHSPAADGVSSVNGMTGAVTVNAINQLTGDITAGPASGSQSVSSTVAKIQGTTVSGTTGTTNVVFNTSPTLITGMSLGNAVGTFTISSPAASGTDQSASAGIMLFQASQGTGTGSGGSIRFQVAPAGVSGSSPNSYITSFQINGNGTFTGGNSSGTTLTNVINGSLKFDTGSGNNVLIRQENSNAAIWLIGDQSTSLGPNVQLYGSTHATLANITRFGVGATTNMSISSAGVVNITNLTASQAIFTDSSKNLVSNAITGTGNVVMSDSPTLTGTINGANALFTGTGRFNGGLGINTDPTSTNIAYFVKNQAASTRLFVSNTNASGDVRAILESNTDTLSFVADTDGTILSGSAFGSLNINQSGNKAINFRTNSNLNMIISGAGVITLGASASTATHKFNGNALQGIASTSTTNFDISRGAGAASISLSGDSGAGNGGDIILFGGSHATAANEVRIRQNGTNKLTVNTSGVVTADNLTISGAFRRKTVATAADYNTLATDDYIGVTSTASPRTITLISVASVNTGHEYIIKDESGGAGTNNITISSSDLIDGASSITITVNYGVARLIMRNSTWWTL